MGADAHVVTHLDLIVQLGAFADHCIPDRAAIHGRVGTDLDVVADAHAPHLGDLDPGAAVRSQPEAVRADHRSWMHQAARAELDSRIGRINGRFGEPDHLPVRYVNRSFRQETLFGFYRASRVALVTPLRDGMNLVAKEFVASQDPGDPGVLVLSRFAGAVRELDAALIVNPFDVDQIADALDRALGMPVEERRARYETMMEQLETHDVHAWRDAFLDALQHPDGVSPARAFMAAE